MNEPKEINETDVELCVEIARQFDEEDLTHPPFVSKKDTEHIEVFKERENEPVVDFENFVTALHKDEGGAQYE